MRARTAGLLLLLLLPVGLADPAQALQRVVFIDTTVLNVEDAWVDGAYVIFVYHGRRITVLRSDVARIEGTRPEPAARPRAAPECLPPRLGEDDQAVRGYFRCLGVTWARSPVHANGHQGWVYEGWVEGRLEQYILRDGRLLEIQAPTRLSPTP